MDVSIILLTFNSQDTISECLDCINLSILSSKLNCELLVIDANSTDNTINIIKKKGLRCELVNIDYQNRSKSFNLGAKKAKGKYLCRVDSRSLIPNNYILECHSFLNNNREYFNVGGKMLPINKNFKIQVLYQNIISFGNAGFRKSNEDKDVETVYLGFFSREDFLNLKGYDEISGFINEETDLNYRSLKKNYKIRLLSNLKVTYLTRNYFKDYFLTMYRYGAARSGFFLKNKILNLRIIAFLSFYLMILIIILFSIFIKNLAVNFIIVVPIFILFIYFLKDLKNINVEINFFQKIKIFTSIIIGHLYWIKGFLLRFFSSKNKYN